MPFLTVIYVAVIRSLALHIKQMKTSYCHPVQMKAIIIIKENYEFLNPCTCSHSVTTRLRAMQEKNCGKGETVV